MARSARKKTAAPKAAAKKRAAKKAAKKTAARKTAVKKAPARAQAVPAAYGSLTPVLIVSPATQAIDFYKRAFGARASLQMDGPGGMVMHAELKIGDSILMLHDEQPPMGPGPQRHKTPKNLGGSSSSVMLYVKNVDAAYAQAVNAGASVVMPPTDMFWGDRYSQVEDPFGHLWSIATHTKDMTPAQMRKAGQDFMASMAPPAGAPAAEG